MRTPFAKPLAALALCGGLALCMGLLAPAAPALALSLGGLFGSPVDAELAAQVPQDKRAGINKADFELACARQDVELAQLKEELADRQDDLANQYTKLAKAQARAAELNLDIAKMEAIIAANLGRAEDNRKVLNDLRADLVKNDADRSQLKSKVNQGTLFVRDWTQRVAQKEKTVAEFKARRSGGAATATAQPKAPAPEPARQDDPVEIINPEPGAKSEAPPAVSAVPEADLKN